MIDPPAAGAPRALVCEDDEGVRFVLERALAGAGLAVTAVGTLQDARAALEGGRFVCAFADIRLPDGSGLDLASEIARRPARPLLVVITAQDTVEHAIEAMRRGADEYLVKPFAIAHVQQLARNAVARAHLDETPAAAGEGEPFSLVGTSPAMREIYKRIGRAASVDLPVLVEGESGTGKELVARAIHAFSSRSQGPFVAVNLAALPASLVESELYGHEKGAFTGANATRPGQFELARGGTLLLDEVGELPLEMQPKLLRALQEGEIARVGGRALRVDVRVLAATNVDLGLAVARGKFRADLYYRLRVFPVRLPPLRERLEDLPALVEHFLRRDGPRLRGRELRLAPEALVALQRHRWSGNVRELENVLRAAIVAAPHATLTAAELEPLLAAAPRGPADWHEAFAQAVQGRLGSAGAHAELLAEAERVVLAEALRKAGGNQVRAAALLGLHRNSLRRRMEELGLAARPREGADPSEGDEPPGSPGD